MLRWDKIDALTLHSKKTHLLPIIDWYIITCGGTTGPHRTEQYLALVCSVNNEFFDMIRILSSFFFSKFDIHPFQYLFGWFHVVIHFLDQSLEHIKTESIKQGCHWYNLRNVGLILQVVLAVFVMEKKKKKWVPVPIIADEPIQKPQHVIYLDHNTYNLEQSRTPIRQNPIRSRCDLACSSCSW